MARCITIGKKRWLAGMTWSSFEDAPSKDELREDAQRLSSTWASVRISEAAVQAGFCAPPEGVKTPAGLFSLAAMLADSREQPWLGIFKISEGLWWYVAVRDGQAILPDGDVCGGEAEILAARERHSGYSDWNYIEGDVHLLEEFIKGIDAKPTRVRALYSTPSATVIPLVISALVASAVGGGYWAWEANRAERMRASELAKERMRLAAVQRPVSAPSPLLTLPIPSVWIERCRDSLFALPLSKDGWVLDKSACDSTAVSASWRRGDGATVASRPEGLLSSDGESVAQTVSLPPLALLAPKASLEAREVPLELAAAKVIFRGWAQAADFTLALDDTAAAANAVSAANLPGAGAVDSSQTNPTAVPIPPPQVGFILDIPISPFGMNLSSIPGLRLTHVKSTTTGWRVEGVLYGR